MNPETLKALIGGLVLDNLQLREERDRWRSTALKYLPVPQEPGSPVMQAVAAKESDIPLPTPTSSGS